MQKLKATIVAIGILLFMGGRHSALAEIACSNGFQNVQGSWLATPYCQDELVAKVAHEYGSKVSVEAIRGNPNLMRAVCRLIGQDIRVKQRCDQANPSENDPP
jgi:hypothetical protein